MPRPVVPIFPSPAACSRATSIALCQGMITCASSEMASCESSLKAPLALSRSISITRTAGSATTPFPMTHAFPGWRIPAGIRWSTVFSPPTTSVCPALLPPWNRTTTSASWVSRSTILPLPSSPHWAPTTTTFGMLELLGRSLRRGSPGIHRRPGRPPPAGRARARRRTIAGRPQGRHSAALQRGRLRGRAARPRPLARSSAWVANSRSTANPIAGPGRPNRASRPS